MSIPSLPQAGPVRLIAILGSVAIVSWLISTVLLARSKRRAETLWSLAILVLAGLTMIAGRLDAALHGVAQLLTVAVAARNVTALRGAPRWLTLLGVVAWLLSAGIAIQHFG